MHRCLFGCPAGPGPVIPIDDTADYMICPPLWAAVAAAMPTLHAIPFHVQASVPGRLLLCPEALHKQNAAHLRVAVETYVESKKNYLTELVAASAGADDAGANTQVIRNILRATASAAAAHLAA